MSKLKHICDNMGIPDWAIFPTLPSHPNDLTEVEVTRRIECEECGNQWEARSDCEECQGKGMIEFTEIMFVYSSVLRDTDLLLARYGTGAPKSIRDWWTYGK